MFNAQAFCGGHFIPTLCCRVGGKQLGNALQPVKYGETRGMEERACGLVLSMWVIERLCPHVHVSHGGRQRQKSTTLGSQLWSQTQHAEEFSIEINRY